MGKKGQASKRGIGEKDPEPRTAKIYFECTPSDYDRVSAAALYQSRSKADILITLIRENLPEPAEYTTGNDTL